MWDDGCEAAVGCGRFDFSGCEVGVGAGLGEKGHKSSEQKSATVKDKKT